MRLPLECALVLLASLAQVHALQIRAHGKRSPLPGAGPHGTLQTRQDAIGLNNSGDITYHTNVVVGNKDFSCLIDTGSSDLWVAGTPSNAKDTGKSVDINYAIGAVSGRVKIAEVKFGSHTVEQQAYLEVPADKTNIDGTGLIGLGPNTGSNIWNALKPNVAGITLLDSIFTQNKSTPNYMTIILSRTEDPTDPFPGAFTIGEIHPNYTDVVNAPRLPVTDVPVREQGDQHFQILLDRDGIIGPGDQILKLNTRVDETKDDWQPTAILDSGFSLSQVPKSVADGFYSRFAGAEFVNVTGVGATWIVPCEMEVNITFTIGGQPFFIHPLDATLNPELLGTQGVVNSLGQPCCIGMFQPITFQKDTFDVILGMSFMRNVYTLIDYGDFAVNNNTQKDDPYVQLLSVTEKAEAHSDFVNVRLGGDDTTANIQLSPFVQQESNSEVKSLDARPDWFWYVVIGASIAGGLLLIVFAWTIFRRKKSGRGAYAKLDDPFQGAGSGGHQVRSQNMDMHAMPNLGYGGDGQRPYDPQSQGVRNSMDRAPPYDAPAGYNNPWDHRY